MTGDTAEAPAWVPPTWEEVVRQHADRVYRLAYRLSGNRADAEDLTQETFVRVFRSLAEYTPGTFEGWLHRITTNLFLDMVRRRQRIRFDALPEDAGDRLAGAGRPPGTGERRRPTASSADMRAIGRLGTSPGAPSAARRSAGSVRRPGRCGPRPRPTCR